MYCSELLLVQVKQILVEIINHQHACARGCTVVTFSVCLSQTNLKMASFYLSERASKHDRRVFKCFK